ncbi:HEPN domain-containing protein [Kordiimonas sp. SCSIO 12610]|uniref:HEPN domain-containing protein n=1 Tax=Kordiimonas sp. SCSIO 12610 TaxID=2829597 RepID=UPI002108DDB2|nr:HEPN domain-containing protein [Kordiimonas sp. SCSIO 12610]UTW56430.1 HEPN domain-containing protein [Kordiimonas sp. SCSIO 12610]
MHQHSIDMSLDKRKSYIIKRLYIDSADQDYITARWAYHNGIFQNFYWCAAQAIEKYLKAIILFQNQSVKPYKHDLNKLFNNVRIQDKKQIIPNKITIPTTDALHSDEWHEQTIEEYIAHLNYFGSPDNRYNILGTALIGPQIHIIDQLAVYFRKMIRYQNFLALDLFDPTEEAFYTSKKPKNDYPEWMIDTTMLLEKLSENRLGIGHTKELRFYFQNMNLFFFKDHNQNEQTFGGLVFRGSPIRTVLQHHHKIDQSNENHKIINQLQIWIRENIPVSKQTLKHLKLLL